MESERMPSDGDMKMPATVGVIGTGNMGGALVRGWSRALDADIRLLVWDKVPAALERLSGSPGVVLAGSLEQLVAESDCLVIVVKPKDGESLLRSLSPAFRPDQMVVSAMAGVELQRIRVACGPTPAVFRIMPNLGVEVGAGMVAMSVETGAGEPGAGGPGSADPATLAKAVALFDALGTAVVVPESSMDIVTAVSGSGPALLALALEGLEDGGVAAGLPRTSARVFARAAMLAAARTLVAEGDSARELSRSLEERSPSVRAGLEVLEERHTRKAFEAAVETAAERSRQMRTPASAGS